MALIDRRPCFKVEKTRTARYRFTAKGVGRRGRGVHNPMMLRKRSISLAGHQTSLALEPEFWTVMDAMARARGLPLAGLIRDIDEGRGERALASACRVAALAHAAAGYVRDVDEAPEV